MENDGLEYNKNVEAFRELEYPMLKGKQSQTAPRTWKLILSTRCHLPGPCWDYVAFKVTHGEIPD